MIDRLTLAALCASVLCACNAPPLATADAQPNSSPQAYSAGAPPPFPRTGLDLESACLAAEQSPAPEGEDMASLAAFTESAVRATQCWTALDAFVSGVRIQHLRATEAGLRRPVGAACIPDSADLPTLQRELLLYVVANPEARAQRAGVVLALSMESSFPCGAPA